MQKAKFIHYFASPHRQQFAVVAACGRRANWLLSTTNEPARVTCDKCRKVAQLEGLAPIKISAVQ